MAGFDGFGPKALDFFKALEFHQNKAWFEENRALYQSDVIDPMVALLGELSERFHARRIPLTADGKKSIFRIHRDVRFSKNKSPYKTHCGAVMTRNGTKNDSGLLYLHIAPEGCFAAAGFHVPSSEDLLKLRTAMAAKPPAFKRVLTSLDKGDLSLGTRSQLTRMPRGFEDQKDGPLDEVIRLKSFLVEEDLPSKTIHSAKLADRIEDFTSRAMPLLRFGWKALE